VARLWCCLKAKGKKGERLIADKTTRGVRIASDGRGEARGVELYLQQERGSGGSTEALWWRRWLGS